MSDKDKPITDPNDPRLLAILKKKIAAAAAKAAAEAKAKGERQKNYDPKAEWEKFNANRDAIAAKYADAVPPWVSAWDAVKKVWKKEVARQQISDMERLKDPAQRSYEAAKNAWISDPNEETYKRWQGTGHALHDIHVNIVKAEKEIADIEAGKTSPSPATHSGFDFTKAGTGNLADSKTDKNGTTYVLKDGSQIVFDKKGNQYSFDADGKLVNKTDKNGKALTTTTTTPAPKTGAGSGKGTSGTSDTTDTQSGSTGVTGAGTGTVTTTPAKPKSQDDWAKEYGTQAALVNSVPELKELFNKAVAGKWTQPKFQAEFNNTLWYKQHNDAWRTAFAAEKTDPASWTHETDLAKNNVLQMAKSLGETLTPDQVNQLARQSLYLAAGSSSRIDQSLLQQHIVQTGIIAGNGGKALTIVDDLKGHGADMGVAHDDQWYLTSAKSVLAGKSVDDFKKQINDVAKTKYSQYADRIDEGYTVKQIASPYMNSMANLLEVPVGSLGLNDTTISKALTNIGAEGKQQTLPLWQFETQLRQDPRWAYTKNAKDTVDSTARSILQTFGLVS